MNFPDPPSPPVATWRVQLTARFGFAEARAVLDHLERLGVSHLYCSPIFETSPGSEHGYDVVDPTRIRAELGGEPAFRALAADARARGMGIIVDIVPNHMAADALNPWWRDVLSRGRRSAFVDFFDIDWDDGDGRIALPVLGAPLDEALERGELRIEREPWPAVRYFDRSFPLAPGAPLPAEGADGATLRALLDRQRYRLAHWRRSAELNYRRFFDISDFVALRVERRDVFEATHGLLLRLVGDGLVTGLRVDHVDGLADPGAYLARLSRRFADARPRPADESTDAPASIVVEKILAPGEELPTDWPVDGATGYEFLVRAGALFVDSDGFRRIEEHARDRLGVAGSLEELEHECKLLVIDQLFEPELRRLVKTLRAALDAADDDGGAALDDGDLRGAIRAVTGRLSIYRTYIVDGPPAAADRRRLDEALARATEDVETASNGTARALKALARVLLRTGAFSMGGRGGARAAEFIVRWQQFTGPVMAKGVEDTALYRHVSLVSLNEVGGAPELNGDAVTAFHDFNRRRLAHTARAMNATSTHDTKRSEDARLRISALSELADMWLDSLERWMRLHEPLRARLNDGPAPEARAEALLYQSLLGAWPLDDAPDLEALAERFSAYMRKAAREAKLRTSWLDPDERYERALETFVREVVAGDGGARFREDAAGLARRVAHIGAMHSLSQVALRSFAPGVPDLYQGAETWDLSLVDPDNRRSVDFDALDAGLTGALAAGAGPEDLAGAIASMLGSWRDGRIKQFACARCHALRRERLEVFDKGEYMPLRTEGAQASRIIAFARRLSDAWVVVLVARLVGGVMPEGGAPVGDAVWRDAAVELPGAAPLRWREWFTARRVDASRGAGAGRVRVADALAYLPAAALVAPD